MPNELFQNIAQNSTRAKVTTALHFRWDKSYFACLILRPVKNADKTSSEHSL